MGYQTLLTTIDIDLYFHGEDRHTVGIDRQMQLLPGPALTRPVLTHLPFAFPKDLHPGGVKGDVARGCGSPARNPDRQGLGPARQLGVVGVGLVHAPYPYPGRTESFHYPI